MLLPSRLAILIALPCLCSGATLSLGGGKSDSDLQPWQVSRVTTFSPSSRPGSSPYSTINITITDPNTIPAGQTPTGDAVFPPSTANCTTQWASSKGELPWDVVTNCSAVDHGQWSFAVQQSDSGTPSPTKNFKVTFTLVDSVVIPGGPVTKTFVGTGDFAVGTNMNGNCGGSGVCGWHLRDEDTPVLITQEEQ